MNVGLANEEKTYRGWKGEGTHYKLEICFDNIELEHESTYKTWKYLAALVDAPEKSKIKSSWFLGGTRSKEKNSCNPYNCSTKTINDHTENQDKFDKGHIL